MGVNMKILYLSLCLTISIMILGADINICGYSIKQFDASHTYVLPDTIIGEGDFIIVARDCSKSAFETFWNTILGSNVLFINSGNTLPMINGDESFALYDSIGTLIDSTNTIMPAGENRCMNRDSSNVNVWSELPSASANPGVFSGANHNAGLIITEFSDSTGTGNYVYEFVEIFNDPSNTGVSISDINKEINIYYDIQTENLVIENCVNSDTDNVQIYNISGQCLYKEIISKSGESISFKEFPAGKYIVRISSRKMNVKSMIIKLY